MTKVNIDYPKCLELAESIYKAYHANELPIRMVGYAVLKEWRISPNKDELSAFERGRILQIRDNVVIPEHIAQIIEKIIYYNSIEYADPMLVFEDGKGINGLFLVNGNNTANALEQVMRFKKLPGLTEVPIAIIPHDMLPSDDENRRHTLELVGTMMNRQPKVFRGGTKNDLAVLIEKDYASGIDVHNKAYQQAKSQSAHIDIRVVRELVSKVVSNSIETSINKAQHFRALTSDEITSFKKQHSNGNNYVQVATVTKDKFFGTLAGVLQHVVEHNADSVHLGLIFKNYSDIRSLKTPSRQKIEAFSEFVTFPVTYEFLDHMQFVQVQSNSSNVLQFVDQSDAA